MRSRDPQFKSLSLSAFITGLFGVTEPAIYGVNLKLKRPFIMGVVAGAIGGAIIGFAGSSSTIFGTLSFVTFPAYFGKGFEAYAFTYFFAMFLACALTYFFGGVKEYEDAELLEEIDDTADESIISPVSGKLVRLEAVNDKTFSSGAMGEGFGVLPTSNKVVSPISGTVTMIFPTGHAIGIRSDNGVEVLIHIGIDTVELNGKGFKKLVKEGNRVHQGDELIEFDKKQIEAAGLDATVITILTNKDSYEELSILEAYDQSIDTGSKIVSLSI